MPDVEHYFRIVSALGLDDLMAEMDDVSGEVYALASPSVRLARWEDGHPERYTSTDKVGGFWRAIAWDEDGDFTHRTGGTRDEARAALSAALGLAEAGATTEGEQHDRSV